MTWANFISLGRLFSVPFSVWLILTQQYESAFWLIFIAGASDMVDGLVARLMKENSVLGSYLDPIADKCMLVALFITLGSQGFLPLWLVILVIFRDVLIVGGTLLLWILDHPFQIKPILSSKINTFLQILLVGFVVGQMGLHMPVPTVTFTLIVLVAVTTVLSGAGYVRLWSKLVK